jgi:hypothetical protein
MEKTIIQQIYNIFKSVKAVKAVYPYPLRGTAKIHPAVIFVGDTSESIYSSNTENLNTYNFKAWVEISLSNTTEEKVFTDIMPTTVDQIVEAFSKNWQHSIAGHTAWLIISSGKRGITEENNSRVAWAELTITYKVSNNI